MLYNKRWLLLMTTCWFACLSWPLSTSALTSVSLEAETGSWRVGQPVAVGVWLNSTENAKAFSVKLFFDFTANTLTWRSFAYHGAWLPLLLPGEDLVDNRLGRALKTAGYPGGFSGRVKLGDIRLSPKRSGDATIALTANSMILDERGDNVFTGAVPLIMKIAVPDASSSAAVTEELKSVEVDGQLSLRLLQSPNEMGIAEVQAMLPNLQPWPSGAKLDWSLRNEAGQRVWASAQELSVETTKASTTLDLSLLTKGNLLLAVELNYDGQAQPLHAELLVDWQAPQRQQRDKMPRLQDVFYVAGGWTTLIIGFLLGILVGFLVWCLWIILQKRLTSNKKNRRS